MAMRPEPLRPVVIALLIVATVVMLASRGNRWRHRARGSPKPGAGRTIALAAIALVLGAYDGFFGPGTGSMLILSFVIVFGDSLTRASGNAKVVNLASNLAAFLLFAQRGTIQWKIALPMAAANAIGAAVGARLALRRGDRLVRWVVLAMVIAVVVKLSRDLAR